MIMVKKILLTLVMSGFVVTQAASINTKKSEFNWLGTKVTGKHLGTIKAQSGNVEIKDDKIVGGKVVIDMSTINVTDLTGDYKKKLENHLKSDDFFNVKKYSTAVLSIKKVYSSTIVADLMIRGKTNKIELPYERKGNTITGEMVFDRSKYDIKYSSGSFFSDLGDKLIHDDVKITYKLVLE